MGWHWNRFGKDRRIPQILSIAYQINPSNTVYIFLCRLLILAVDGENRVLHFLVQQVLPSIVLAAQQKIPQDLSQLPILAPIDLLY